MLSSKIIPFASLPEARSELLTHRAVHWGTPTIKKCSDNSYALWYSEEADLFLSKVQRTFLVCFFKRGANTFREAPGRKRGIALRDNGNVRVEMRSSPADKKHATGDIRQRTFTTGH